MGKDDAMKDMLDLVNEKAKRRRDLRDQSQPDSTHVQEVLKFLNSLDLLTAEAKNELDFYVGMEGECKRLKYRLKEFDPYAKALVEWNDTKDWKELRPTGVRIYWSRYYMNLHPGAQQEEYIDVSRLLLDDYE